MAWVDPNTVAIWQSGTYVGADTPAAVVQVQLGGYIRGYPAWANDPNPSALTIQPVVDALLWGEGSYAGGSNGPAAGYWQPVWHAASPWYDVPNLSSIKRTRDISAKGVSVLEVILDAQDFEPKVGALGDAYHAIVPGYLAPDRNWASPNRPNPNWVTNQWSPSGSGASGPNPPNTGLITNSVKIRVWQGYGAPQTDLAGNTPPIDGGTNGAWVFAGLIDDVDLDGEPNTITLTARNGKLLTDLRVFKGAKSPQIQDPITFYDTLAASSVGRHGSGANASSSNPNALPRNVLDPVHNTFKLNDPGYQTTWQSQNNVDAGNLEWVEIRLPQGRYSQFWLEALTGMSAYVGIYARPLAYWAPDPTGNGGLVETLTPATFNGAPLAGGLTPGWIDTGLGTAAGANGGWPFIAAYTTGHHPPPGATGTSGGGYSIDQANIEQGGAMLELGHHSILRIGFLNAANPGPAIVGDVRGLRLATQQEINQQRFILVNDASDVVKVVLRWAGYQRWNVETAGVRLSDGTNFGPGVVLQSAGRLSFNRSKYLIDVIDEVAKQLGFIFFIADPVDANDDGMPTFRHDSSLVNNPGLVVAEIDETTMLTGLKTKSSDEDKVALIRVRGKTATIREGGMPLGGDTVLRIMAIYAPPWARGGAAQVTYGPDRSAGVLRQIVYEDDQLTTYAMCLYGCFLIALNAAAQMHTAVAEIPTNLQLELDDQVGILDEATGTNSRLWIVKTEDTMTLGQNASWKQTLEGSLLDTVDMQQTIAECEGLHPTELGDPGVPGASVVVPALNWRNVTDPAAATVTGFTSPITLGNILNWFFRLR